jgi:hypothetical protein
VRGGLQLDSREGLRVGGDSGPAIIPAQPTESLVIEALKYQSLEMPPSGPLPNQVIEDFSEWIRRGAIDPRLEVVAAKLPPVDWQAAISHWAFQPLQHPAPPAFQRELASHGPNWPSTPIDLFIANGRIEGNFSPSVHADKRVLIRRATFDLLGLPPTVEEVRDFVEDESPDSYARVVDRLLSSPAYGERWGRHWLDLVRYADTNGADENHPFPNAWRYRDWVVRKWNEDLPFDEFIIQQLAGDLLPVPENEFDAGELLTATGMLVIGPKMLAEQDKDKMLIDIVDEQVDTVGRTMLGLTIGCARCHDHKFDPVSTHDYYALAGIFYSTQTMADREFVSNWMERPLPSAEIDRQRAAYQPKLDEARARLKQIKSELAEAQSSSEQVETETDLSTSQGTTEQALPGAGTEQELKAHEELLKKLEDEMPRHELVMSVQDATPVNLPIHLRGNHLTLSEQVVPRGLPAILTRVNPAPKIGASASGRLEFARWLVSPNNPLTARVMVNRIWMWHFGKPLMPGPSNFGLQAERPTHPELLDWLAGEFIRRDWSIKEIHRLIMLSATYQMSSQASSDEDERRDPDNIYWRRFNKKRLEAEAFRDAILFVGGDLDAKLSGIAVNTDAKRRAFYLPINRSSHYEMFSAFDYVETGSHIEQRPITTVPHQALFAMNSPLVLEQSRRLASSLCSKHVDCAAADDRVLLDKVFEQLVARLPRETEAARCLEFLQQVASNLPAGIDASEQHLQAWSSLVRALLAGNEFIYVE